jgi:hypothetical protein
MGAAALMKLESIIEMPCLFTGLWKRFGVHLFEGKVTVADMEEIERRSVVWHEKIRGKLVEMVVIFPSEAKMTSEERSKMTQIIRRWESSRSASATVILAQGLVGAMHRSVLTGMQMIVPAPHPAKVFGAVADGVKWLAPHIRELCGPEATPEALEAGVGDLVTRFVARPIKAPRVDA